MNIKERLRSFHSLDVGGGKLCREALAEIERLEQKHTLAIQWLGYIAKGENFTTAVSEEITMASAESLRYMAASTLKRLAD